MFTEEKEIADYAIQKNHFGLVESAWVCTDKDYTLPSICEHIGIDIRIGRSITRIRNDKYIPIETNDILIFNGYEKHIWSHDEKTKAFDFTLYPKLIDPLLKELDILTNDIYFHNIVYKPDHHLLNLIQALSTIVLVDNVSQFIYDCIATEIAVIILSTYKHNYSHKITKHNMSGYFPANFAKAKKIINESIVLGEDLNLNSIASFSGMSKYHFLRYFKKHVGITPMQYVNKVRMDIACQKLMFSNDSILTISNSLGINEISTFNRNFKKFNKLIPSEYRNKFKEKERPSWI